MSLAEYQALDLSPSGPLAQALASRLPQEASLPVVTLSAPFGADTDAPAKLTPGMAAWYRHGVAAARRTALAEIRAGFEGETLPDGNRGFLAESEVDRIEQAKQAALKTERDAFFQKKAIRDLHERLGSLQADYERKRAEHGRDAVRWEPIIYYVTLTFLALALEAPLNFESFLKIDYYTPAFATGSFLFVALALGSAGHIIGQVARQKGERFGGNVPSRTRSDSWIQVAIAVVLATLALGLVAYSRKYLLDEAIARSLALGETVGLGNYLAGVGVMLANVGVFVLSIWYSYAKHDPVPGFAEERRLVERLRKRVGKHYRRDLEGRQQQKILQAQRETEQVQRREAEQAKLLRPHGRYRAGFEELRRIDSHLLALLEDYRNRLVGEARRAGIQTRFVFDDMARGDVATRVEIDGETYLIERLRLPFA